MFYQQQHLPVLTFHLLKKSNLQFTFMVHAFWSGWGVCVWGGGQHLAKISTAKNAQCYRMGLNERSCLNKHDLGFFWQPTPKFWWWKRVKDEQKWQKKLNILPMTPPGWLSPHREHLFSTINYLDILQCDHVIEYWNNTKFLTLTFPTDISSWRSCEFCSSMTWGSLCQITNNSALCIMSN